ncbi:MAG: response regulator [Spirochaetota bacterium]
MARNLLVYWGTIEEPCMDKEKRLLVIDVAATTQEPIRSLLCGRSFAIDIAEDGLRAKQILEADPSYDGIICDIEMPVIDGFELLAWVRSRKETRHLPVIMVSGLDILDVLDRSARIGEASYIMKPVTIEKMNEALVLAGI